MADEIGGGPQMGLAGSVFVAGEQNRVAFGVIDDQAGFVYGKTALYVARTPDSPAKGPYVGSRRRARDRGAVPLPAGGDRGRPVRRRLRRPGPAPQDRAGTR